eukprot:TRINITY_DN7303_c0_g1_i2.p1 TRINITY_DN7303_c0_g1~~TRINITY_DN7303_c0_g1_i2.p1  ORF type:complete len:146 (+),score=27.86 TRINITY_DN7303_c0_g1_i2:341-778(+)
MLLWTKNAIPTALTQIDKMTDKEAKVIYKNLLGIMGDKQMQFPAILTKEVLDKGIINDKLRDEIYLQLIKQLTQNPNPESVKKGWKLLHLCLQHFPPTDKFENYLEIWLRNESKGDDKYLKSMHATLFKGPAKGTPSAEELEKMQ